MAAPLRISSLLPRPSSFAKTSRQLLSRRCTATTQCRATKDSIISKRSGLALKSRKELQLRCVTINAQPTTTKTEEPVLKPYRPPTTGILSMLPRSWVPYAELIRLDKPVGTYYLFLPCLFSTLLAAPLTSPMVPPTTVLYTAGVFFTGALIMRGAGCTVNDLWDRNLDPHVARTRLRPIARGAITVRQAIPYLGVQLLSGLVLLLQFPYQCLFYGIPSLLFVASYPLAKRVTNYPQAVLGLTFSWGAMMGFPALGIDLLSNTPALISAACLYGSCVAWTMVYDMIYAYQDIKYDAKAGIKSIALAQEANAKAFLSAVSGVQVALLTGAGLAIGAGPAYFIGTCGGAAATLGYMIWKVNLQSVNDCWAWFKKGAWFTGGAISFGLSVEYLLHYLGISETYGIDETREIERSQAHLEK
ncbi:4-hydroxybenzoate polyprenyltransferase, mitochondrial [Pseudocercospora fuligena]|uniref:4-hydroxybenzoate polyprenyltransferase, mitochondrial n=1 Tax=Pseudocercospora fuligena TaxID=685502 RepID=A0A8H6VCA7_9PEZI|nr:4-hydroxybenzoate polyprenyltransferase, mitochondrial [Pseudocercospora fuligena]